MKERAAPFGRLRSFGPVTSQGTVAKYLSQRKDIVAGESILLAGNIDGRENYAPLASR
jgi:hypothetical protein